MKVTITVGSVQLSTKGIDLDRKEIRRLLMDVASVAAAMADDPVTPEPANPVGFSAHVERSSPLDPEALYTDDEEWGS